MFVSAFILLSIIIFLNGIVCDEHCQKDYKFCGENDLTKCVPNDWWCDGHRDCDTGRDELNCPVTACYKTEIQCKTGTQCIPKFLKCDGTAQCLDQSDEENCNRTKTKTCNSFTEFDCKNDGEHCIPLSNVCDRHNDCGSNEDEEPGGSKDNCQKNDCRLTPNGGCSHLCTNLFTRSVCHCPDGHRLLDDRKTCVDINECDLLPARCSQICNNTIGGYECLCHNGYVLNPKIAGECIAKDGDRSLLVGLENGQIINVDLENNIDIIHNISTPSNSWLNIDVHIGSGDNTTIFWSQLKNSNVGQTIIKRKPGTTDRFEVISHKQIFQMHNGSFCAGLSFDWLRSLLFWTRSEEPHIYVTNTTSNITSVLLSKGLENPRSIVADPFEARLYWIDWGNKMSSPRIETMLMNGRDRRVMIKSGLRQPLGIAIDFLSRRLYWTDIRPGSIMFIDLNRPLMKKTVISDQQLHPFSLSIFENKVFWSDWRQNQIISVGKTIGNNLAIVAKILKPMSIVFLNRLRTPALISDATAKSQIHTCVNTQPQPCSDICLPSPPTTISYYATVKCVCRIGLNISHDKRTCLASHGSLILPNNINRFKIIVAVLISLVVIISLSMIIILLYLCRYRFCNQPYKNLTRYGFKHPVVNGDLMYIFNCHSHSSQLSELLSSDLNSVSNT